MIIYDVTYNYILSYIMTKICKMYKTILCTEYIVRASVRVFMRMRLYYLIFF